MQKTYDETALLHKMKWKSPYKQKDYIFLRMTQKKGKRKNIWMIQL